MQENDTNVQSSAPAPKPTKYRLACDSCQHSKIRCDQERPKCRRCAKKGMECVYSPAKRAGRPRTRNNSKSSSYLESSASVSRKGYPTPITEKSIAASTSNWASLSTSDNCSNSSSSSGSSSNASAFSSMAQTFQMPSPENLDFSLYQQSEEDFLQGLPDLTGSQCGTPEQNINCYYPTSPSFHIAPELLNLDLSGTTWQHPEAQQQQQQQYGQHDPTSATILLDEGLPYFGLITPDYPQPVHHAEQQQENMAIQATNNNHEVKGYNHPITPPQQKQPQFPQPSEDASLSARSCKCVPTLLDHLSTSSRSPTSSSFDSVSATLSASRTLISSCCTAMACPNACSARPSAALVICEAIDRALTSLKVSGTSLWTSTLTPVPNPENGACSPLSSSSSSSSLSPSSNKNGSNDNEIMLPSSLVDEEHEPLRCGTLAIRGADRRAVVRVLLVKRVLEVQGVLERLRDTLLLGSLGGGDVSVKKPLLTLCADVVEEFAGKVAQKVEIVKLQM